LKGRERKRVKIVWGMEGDVISGAGERKLIGGCLEESEGK